MELMNHGDVADKDLVNQFGGIAYDHESMPKVVAVHTWTAEMHSSTNQPGTDAVLPSVEQLPSNICYSMKIGIRSRPQTPDDVGSQRRFTGFKENWGVKNTKFGNKLTHPSSFGLEKHGYNTVTTSSNTNGLLRTLLQEDTSGGRECYPSHNKTFWGKELAIMSRCNLLLMDQTDNKIKAVTEALPFVEKLTSPHSFDLPDTIVSEANKSGNGNLEIFDWSSVGLVADKRDHLNSSIQQVQPNTNNSSQLICSGNNSNTMASAGSEYLQEQAIKSSSSHEPPNLASYLPNVPEQCSGTGIQMSHIRPRKRPRKSTPRKIDIEWKNSCTGSHSTDSEETLSGEDIPSESENQCVPVSAGSHCRLSPRSDEESFFSGTKVLFKKTAGVWSVSPVNSGIEENKESHRGTRSSNSEPSQSQDTADALQPLFGFDCNAQVKNMCGLFTDRPMASLKPYDPLETCFSPALDREARIKELLGKQEKLLEKMRQKKPSSD